MRSFVAVALLLALGAYARAEDAQWREVAWPFLRDAWPNGRAFECKGGACGDGLTLTARVKVGFCDCSRGVYDDDEIDRVGDVDLVSVFFKPVSTSEPASFLDLSARTRLYETNEWGRHRVLSLAGGRNCNAIVAMAIAPGNEFPAGGAEAAKAFINTPEFGAWVRARESGR